MNGMHKKSTDIKITHTWDHTAFIVEVTQRVSHSIGRRRFLSTGPFFQSCTQNKPLILLFCLSKPCERYVPKGVRGYLQNTALIFNILGHPPPNKRRDSNKLLCKWRRRPTFPMTTTEPSPTSDGNRNKVVSKIVIWYRLPSSIYGNARCGFPIQRTLVRNHTYLDAATAFFILQLLPLYQRESGRWENQYSSSI